MTNEDEPIPLEPFPVAIATGARVAAGRGLIATRAIAAGEVVLRCAPLLVALDDSLLLERCTFCCAAGARGCTRRSARR